MYMLGVFELWHLPKARMDSATIIVLYVQIYHILPLDAFTSALKLK